jgi:CRP/FNR family transcriptional regulator
MLNLLETQEISSCGRRGAGVEEGTFLPTCAGCIARELKACPGFGVSGGRLRPLEETGGVKSAVQTFPARRQILHAREFDEVVPVICSGWAASSTVTQNGKRQVLAFLLGGDLASINYLFESCSGRTIEAITPVTCRKFLRSDLQAAALRVSLFFSLMGKALAAERQESDRLNLDLHRRPAEARVARLLLSLLSRLKRANKADGDTFEFPLRQQHLADALGLTAVHVCKVMSRLRAARIIAVARRHLTILDRNALEFMAER